MICLAFAYDMYPRYLDECSHDPGVLLLGPFLYYNMCLLEIGPCGGDFQVSGPGPFHS